MLIRHRIRANTSILEVDLCSAQGNVGASSKWGRHGFDGIACGREACRGVDTRNRSQNYKCRTSIRACCLISKVADRSGFAYGPVPIVAQ